MSKYSTDEEIWEDIVGYETKYQVSNLGRVRSLDRYPLFKDGRKRLLKGQILKPMKDTNGRLYVKLSNNENVRKHKSISRMVATAFLGSPEDALLEVNHIDGNPLNNHIKNLEWTTRQENMKHAVDNDLFRTGEDSPHNKVLISDVEDIFKLKFVELKTNEEIATIYHVTRQTIDRIINGKSWQFKKDLDYSRIHNQYAKCFERNKEKNIADLKELADFNGTLDDTAIYKMLTLYYDRGVTQKVLSSIYNISRSRVGQIVNGHSQYFDNHKYLQDKLDSYK